MAILKEHLKERTTKYSVKKYISLIEDWHHARNLILGSTDKDQMLKLYQEYGEFCLSQCRNVSCKDDIGDMFVVLVNIAARNGVSLLDNVKNLDKILNSVVEDVFDTTVGTLCCESSYLPVALGYLNDRICKGEMTTGAILWMFSLLVLTSYDNGVCFVECVDTAWNDIKDRKGKMIDGIFVKGSDLS